MVINPKNSQRLVSGLLNDVLNFIYNTSIVIGEKLSETDLASRLRQEIYSGTSDQISKTVYDLKRRKYIEVEGSSVVLTNKAKMRIVDKIVANLGKEKLYYFVSFDIPEWKRVARDQFRRAIKRMGFVQIQKSLWVCQRNVGELVEAAAKEYEVSDDAAYFISEKSNIDKFIRKRITAHKATHKD